MKKLIIFIFIPFFFLCLFNYSNIIIISKDIWVNFIMKIIPSLLPMLLLTNIFIKGGFFIKIINKIPRSKNIIIILLVILLGSPSSITFLNDIKKQNIINEQEKDILFSSFGGISIPFLFKLTILYPSLKGIWYLLIYYLGEFIVYFFQKNKYSKIKNIKNVSINRSIYINSIKDSFKSLSIIILNLHL